MKYSKEELINYYAKELVQNENFVNHWMKEGFTFYDCYTILKKGTATERKDFVDRVSNYLMAQAKKELGVLLVGFDVEQTDGYYNWTSERYFRVRRWLGELVEREQ